VVALASTARFRGRQKSRQFDLAIVPFAEATVREQSLIPAGVSSFISTIRSKCSDIDSHLKRPIFLICKKRR
jgi:hypothetical protein